MQTLLEGFVMTCHAPNEVKTGKRMQNTTRAFWNAWASLKLKHVLSLSHVNYKFRNNSNVTDKSTRLVSCRVFPSFSFYLKNCSPWLQLLGEGGEILIFFFLFWNVGLQHQDKSKETSWFWSWYKLRPAWAGVSAAGWAAKDTHEDEDPAILVLLLSLLYVRPFVGPIVLEKNKNPNFSFFPHLSLLQLGNLTPFCSFNSVLFCSAWYFLWTVSIVRKKTLPWLQCASFQEYSIL